jgi:hypothetical protein
MGLGKSDHILTLWMRGTNKKTGWNVAMIHGDVRNTQCSVAAREKQF